MIVIYVSGKYTDKTPELQEQNTEKAKQVAIKLWNMGYSVICPHMNTYHFDTTPNCELSYDDYIKGDIAAIDCCDAIYMVGNWKQSKGAKIEHRYAVINEIPILHSMDNAKIFLKNHVKCELCEKCRNINIISPYCLKCREKAEEMKKQFWWEHTKDFIPVSRM